MGSWATVGSKPSTSSATGTSGVAPSFAKVSDAAYGLSTEFEDDGAVPMPTMSDAALQAAAKLRRDLMARSGRSSTDLTGTRTYFSSSLGAG